MMHRLAALAIIAAILSCSSAATRAPGQEIIDAVVSEDDALQTAAAEAAKLVPVMLQERANKNEFQTKSRLKTARQSLHSEQKSLNKEQAELLELPKLIKELPRAVVPDSLATPELPSMDRAATFSLWARGIEALKAARAGAIASEQRHRLGYSRVSEAGKAQRAALRALRAMPPVRQQAKAMPALPVPVEPLKTAKMVYDYAPEHGITAQSEAKADSTKDKLELSDFSAKLATREEAPENSPLENLAIHAAKVAAKLAANAEKAAATKTAEPVEVPAAAPVATNLAQHKAAKAMAGLTSEQQEEESIEVNQDEQIASTQSFEISIKSAAKDAGIVDEHEQQRKQARARTARLDAQQKALQQAAEQQLKNKMKIEQAKAAALAQTKLLMQKRAEAATKTQQAEQRRMKNYRLTFKEASAKYGQVYLAHRASMLQQAAAQYKMAKASASEDKTWKEWSLSKEKIVKSELHKEKVAKAPDAPWSSRLAKLESSILAETSLAGMVTKDQAATRDLQRRSMQLTGKDMKVRQDTAVQGLPSDFASEAEFDKIDRMNDKAIATTKKTFSVRLAKENFRKALLTSTTRPTLMREYQSAGKAAKKASQKPVDPQASMLPPDLRNPQ